MSSNTIFRPGYVIRDQEAPHFLTLTVCGWIDLFTRKSYRDLILENLNYCINEKGLEIGAWVIMSNHVHLIATATGKEPLSAILRDFKKFTSKRMIEMVKSNEESRRQWMIHQFEYYGSRHAKKQDFQIWTNDNHPEALYTGEMTLCKINYIHQNPVRAGLVLLPEHFVYSSAIDYAGGKGLLPVRIML